MRIIVEMEDTKKKDIVRYTLHSYVGKSIKSIQLDADQKKAIGILTNFSEEKFEMICLDLINEIRRRNGLTFDTPSSLGEKLINMDESKFKSLVMESLVVFYIKNSQFKIEEMPELLENMTKFIKTMKNQTEKDIFVSQIENLPFYDKLKEFIEFAQKKGVDEFIALNMKQQVNKEIENGGLELINVFSYPEAFVDTLFKSELYEDVINKNLTAVERLEELNKHIKEAICFNNVDLETRASAIKKYMNEVISIVLDNISYPTKKIEYFEGEIQLVTNILEKIELEIKKNRQVDLDQISNELTDVMGKIIEKGTNLSKERISELKIQQISAEMMGSTLSRKDSFRLVLDIAKDIRKALATV